MAAPVARPFMIDNILIPTPDSYKAGVMDLSSKESGRNLKGSMSKDVVAVKDTYECQWTTLSWEETASLLNAVDGKASFQFTYADPRYPHQWRTGTFYVGDRSAAALNLNDPDNTWSGISMKFVRV